MNKEIKYFRSQGGDVLRLFLHMTLQYNTSLLVDMSHLCHCHLKWYLCNHLYYLLVYVRLISIQLRLGALYCSCSTVIFILTLLS